MAHELDFSTGGAAFMEYTAWGQQPAWHGLGHIIREPEADIMEWLRLSRTDFTVAPVKISYNFEPGQHPDFPDGALIDGKVRGMYRTDTGAILADSVGDQYTLVQNRDAFPMFQELVNSGAVVETMGALKGGRITFMLVNVATFEALKGDQVRKYALIINGCDGNTGMSIRLVNTRVVCANTLGQALNEKSSPFKMSVRHTPNVKDNFNMVAKLLKATLEQTKQEEQAYKELAKIKLTDKQLLNMFGTLFYDDTHIKGLAEGKGIGAKMQGIQDKFLELHETGIGQQNIRGTGWGFVNAVSLYLGTEKKYNAGAEARFSQVYTGEDSKLLTKANDLGLNPGKAQNFIVSSMN